MSSVFKGKSKKSKAHPGQKSGIEPPAIRVEETPPNLPREGSFRHKAKETLQNLFSIRPSHSRAASRGPSERGKSQEYLPVLDTAANPNVGVAIPITLAEKLLLLFSDRVLLTIFLIFLSFYL
ncbi:hypothetical protein M378DRAFT_167697 [Amanita muscaria Koide BX008]|uniref:Uncharacterized protein n=1 Tax=Amanita muscaria (strain Koide BX008) TaxID=946122 RepID=A0A0C2WVB3_AMAMK|nr:hypothetical protein M378DRAFT_167697 [Amanita muscaria Koide BX008]